MAGFNLFPGRQPLTGLDALLFGSQNPQSGLGGFQQTSQSPDALALGGGQAPAPPPPMNPTATGIDQFLPQRKPVSQGARIFGAIGDAMAAFGGKEPLFYNAQQKAAEDERDQRKAVQALITKAWIEKNYPDTPASVAEANAINAMTPEGQAQYAHARDLVSPAIQTGPQGAVVVPRSYIANGMGGGSPPSGIARPQTQADWSALPPGTSYYAPDGTVRTKGGAGQGGPQTFRPGY